jgi:putative ABC transport system ATP-binding protein
MKPVIELNDVEKTYKMGDVEVSALKKVDLKIDNEEFVAIMGPSGSGKSTLLQIIGCLDRPSSGTIYLDGVDISKLSDSKLARVRGNKIGFVFQSFNLYPTLNAVENVELPMMIVEKNTKERKKRALNLLKIVAIARALANDPSLILADEPTGNLDSKTGYEIMLFLNRLQKKEGKTVVMVTHEKDIAKYAKRIIHLRDGEITR